MKSSSNFIFIPFLFLLISGFTSHDRDKVREQPKVPILPPGTAWLRDSTFIDATEIRNLDYLEFLYWLNRENDSSCKRMLPDTLVWKSKSFYNEPYVMYYLRHPSYRDYPVVGISYDQAVAFCKWRTDRVNEFIWIASGGSTWEQEIANNNRKDWPDYFTYRLPTKSEWEYAASSALDHGMYPYGYENVIDSKRIPVSNTKEFSNLYQPPKNVNISHGEEHMSQAVSMVDPTNLAYFGKPSSFGLFNMIGNVSEIIADTIVKGYNFLTYLDGNYTGGDGTFAPRYPDSLRFAYYENDYKYNGPRQWLGFRCVAVRNNVPINAKAKKAINANSEAYVKGERKRSKQASKYLARSLK